MPITKLQYEFIDHLLVKPESGLSNNEWAKLHSLHPQTVKFWLQKPEFKAIYESKRKDYEEQVSHTGRRMWQAVAERNYRIVKECEEAYTKASKTDKPKWMAELRKCNVALQDSVKFFATPDVEVDLTGWKDEELWNEIIARGLTGGDPWTESSPSSEQSQEEEPSISESALAIVSATKPKQARKPRASKKSSTTARS